MINLEDTSRSLRRDRKDGTPKSSWDSVLPYGKDIDWFNCSAIYTHQPETSLKPSHADRSFHLRAKSEFFEPPQTIRSDNPRYIQLEPRYSLEVIGSV